MDRFSELSAFAAVIEAGGFSAAARQMGQSRSSVNRLVIALEARLGVQLLQRTTRSVAPTSAGRALYGRARQVLEDLHEMERAVSDSGSEIIGTLRINAPLSFGDLDFSRLVAAFLADHPKVQLELILESRLVDPVAEGYDLVIRVAEPDEETTLVDHRIMALTYQLCASPAYLAAQGVPRTAKDLRGHAALAQVDAAAAGSWTLIGPDGPVKVKIDPVLSANTMESLLKGACAGLGIAILPAYAVRSDLASGRLCPVLPDYAPPARMLQVIYPPARHLSAKVRAFVDFVEHWCLGDGLGSPGADPGPGPDPGLAGDALRSGPAA